MLAILYSCKYGGVVGGGVGDWQPLSCKSVDVDTNFQNYISYILRVNFQNKELIPGVYV